MTSDEKKTLAEVIYNGTDKAAGVGRVALSIEPGTVRGSQEDEYFGLCFILTDKDKGEVFRFVLSPHRRINEVIKWLTHGAEALEKAVSGLNRAPGCGK